MRPERSPSALPPPRSRRAAVKPERPEASATQTAVPAHRRTQAGKHIGQLLRSLPSRLIHVVTPLRARVLLAHRDALLRSGRGQSLKTYLPGLDQRSLEKLEASLARHVRHLSGAGWAASLEGASSRRDLALLQLDLSVKAQLLRLRTDAVEQQVEDFGEDEPRATGDWPIDDLQKIQRAARHLLELAQSHPLAASALAETPFTPDELRQVELGALICLQRSGTGRRALGPAADTG